MRGQTLYQWASGITFCLSGCQRLLVRPGEYSRNRQEGRRAGAVQGDGRLKKKEWVAEQSESILISWISLLFLPNEMTFISANPIWVAKIFIFILIDIVAAENEARWDIKSILEVRVHGSVSFSPLLSCLSSSVFRQCHHLFASFSLSHPSFRLHWVI